MLRTTTQIDMDSSSAQDVYEVPIGQRLVPLFAVFRDPTPGTFDVGNTFVFRLIDSSTGNQIAYRDLNNATDPACMVVCPVNNALFARIIPSGSKVQVQLDAPYGSEQTCTVDLFGYLID